MTEGRLTPQAHKRHPTQPTSEAARQGLVSTFVLYITSRSKLSCPLSSVPSSLCPVSFAQAPLHSTEPVHVPTSSLQHQEFPWGGAGGGPTHRPEGDQHRFFGKIPMRRGPYSFGTATATFLSSSGWRRQCQSFIGNLHYVEQKWFRTPWGALKQYDILSNLIQFHIFCQCFPNFVVLWIWQLFRVYPYKTGSAFKEKCAQAKSASSLPAIMGTFSISFAFL